MPILFVGAEMALCSVAWYISMVFVISVKCQTFCYRLNWSESNTYLKVLSRGALQSVYNGFGWILRSIETYGYTPIFVLKELAIVIATFGLGKSPIGEIERNRQHVEQIYDKLEHFDWSRTRMQYSCSLTSLRHIFNAGLTFGDL